MAPGFPSCSPVHMRRAPTAAGERLNEHAAESGLKLKLSTERESKGKRVPAPLRERAVNTHGSLPRQCLQGEWACKSTHPLHLGDLQMSIRHCDLECTLSSKGRKGLCEPRALSRRPFLASQPSHWLGLARVNHSLADFS